MNKLRGLIILLVSFLFCATAQAGNPFSALAGKRAGGGTVKLLNEAAASVTCTQGAQADSATSLFVKFKCNGAKSMYFSCNLDAQSSRVSGSCSGKIGMWPAGLTVRGRIIGKKIFLSGVSTVNTYSTITFTPTSFRFRCAKPRLLEAVDLRFN